MPKDATTELEDDKELDDELLDGLLRDELDRLLEDEEELIKVPWKKNCSMCNATVSTQL